MLIKGAHDSVVGRGTMLQAGGGAAGSIPDEVIGFFNWPSRTLAQRSAQPLSEMSTRNLPRGKGLPARRTDSLAAICEPAV
jgi:hypothetical protein